MIWQGLSRLRGSSLTVLFFHRVAAQTDPLMPAEATAAWFEAMLRWLRSQFTLLPLPEATRRWQDGTLPRAAAAITFDDGYRDNAEVAAPLLQRLGVPATFFIASGFLDGGLMWNDGVAEAVRRSRAARLDLAQLGLEPMPLADWPSRSAAVSALLTHIKYLPFDERERAVGIIEKACGTKRPRDLMMSREQVRGLHRQGFDIGAHTLSHPILSKLPDDDARHEISHGREQLEACIDAPVRLFAYPNGRAGRDYDERHCAMVQRAGFEAAYTTNPGVCASGSDRWQLPRFTPWDRAEYGFRLQLLRNQWARVTSR